MSALELDARHRAAAAFWAREEFYFFTRWMYFQRTGQLWMRAPHHEVIADALTRLYLGEFPFLIVNVPPRYSKTEMVENFVGWGLGKHPDSEFIYTSYSSTLAENNSWQTLRLVTHPAYGQIFPDVRLNRDSRSDWRTTEGGIVYAAGAGGTITGFGAGKSRSGFGGAIIIDDPHKPDESESDVVRQGVITWFQNTIWTRRNSAHTPIIVIMQRLHESDLSGWLLAGGMGVQWKHICLPALRDDGSALWPEKHTVEALRIMERASPYMFAGQFQQRPAPLEGGIFKPDNLVVIPAIPFGTRFVRAWDLAATQNDGAYTAGAKLGVMPDGRYLIADMRRLQGSPDQVEVAIVNTAAADGTSVPVGLPQDPGQAGKAQVIYLTRQLAGYTVESSPESGDKITRAEPFASQVNVGNVCMLRGEWNDALVGEMRVFPNGTYKDQIDALSRAFHMLNGARTWAFAAA